MDKRSRMFIAGAYRHNTINESRLFLDPIVSSMAQTMLLRNEHCYYIQDSEICFVSNSEHKSPSDLILVYAGQFFNIEELKVRFSLPNDSSCETVLKSAYKKWSCDFISHIAGEFVIALYDKINNQLFLSRDRVGLKPLYYCYDETMLMFASEVKALLRVKEKRTLSFASLHSGIVFGSVYSREHLVEGVYELRPGHNLIMNSQSKIPVHHQYWDRVFNITKHPFSYYERGFKLLLNEAVKKRLPSPNVKVGISFSGGIDSTVILALVKEFYPGPIETYTAAAEGDKFSELREARFIAKHFQIKHHEIFITAYEAIQSLPKVIWHMGEFTTPYRFASIPLQTYFVGKLAKENGCSCLFTGNGVEHNLDGNGAQRIVYKYYHNSKKTPKFIHDIIIPLLPSRIKNVLRRKYSYFLTTEEMNNIAELYFLANSWWWWAKELYLKGLYTEGFARSIGSYSAQDIISEYLEGCAAQDYFNKLLYIDFKTWNSRRNLVTNERLFGAFGIQLQIPFLDVDLIRFSSSMPISVKHNFKDDKYFIRRIYNEGDVLPPEVFKKGKRDSILHFDFCHGPTLDVISYFVNSLKKRKIFREHFIDRVLQSAKKKPKRGEYYFRIFGLFELELWFRIFIDHPDIEEENLTLDYLDR